MIPVTKPYLPDRAKLDRYIDGIYERNWLTNSGPLYTELTQRLSEYLGVEHLLLVSNGTLALQVAYRALGVTPVELAPSKAPSAITTPFTFVATSSSLQWEGIQPRFSDIDPKTWCLDPSQIEQHIDAQTKAIVPVHVFGNTCDLEAIDQVAAQHGLKVIYDAAHAFGVTYKGESVLKWGDAATLSFHATKVFHTIEGGAIVFKRKEDLERAQQIINFGITGPDQIGALGVNAKLNEFQAAMGLCVLDELAINTERRTAAWQFYAEAFKSIPEMVQLQRLQPMASNNAAYFPIVLQDEALALAIQTNAREQGIQLRRYFYPSLDSVTAFSGEPSCKVSLSIASRILCLPLYANITREEQQLVIDSVQAML